MGKAKPIVAFSFIGISSHEKKLTYLLDGKEYRATFFAELVRERFKPDAQYLLITKESSAKHGAQLVKLGFTADNFIVLPSGVSETDLWQMYYSLFPKIPENAEVILDVTHGFRAQPMMAMMVAQYAITIKNIDVKALLYGTYNSDFSEVQPAYDLKPILDIAEWNYVFSIFRETWNAVPLNTRLKKMHLHQMLFEVEPFKKLERLGKAMHLFSTAFQQVRIKTLPGDLRFAYDEVSSMILECGKKPYFKPLEDMLRVISRQLESYLLPEEYGIFTKEGFSWQIKLVERYVELEQFGQAFALGLEILLSLYMNKTGMSPDDFDQRKVAQVQIRDLINTGEYSGPVEIEQTAYDFIREIALKIEAYRLYRNSISHADMNDNQLKTSKLATYSSNLLDALKPYAT